MTGSLYLYLWQNNFGIRGGVDFAYTYIITKLIGILHYMWNLNCDNFGILELEVEMKLCINTL